LDSAAESCWSALGNELANAFHLRGLFGVDAILRDGVPWPIEINPRYTASVEVLERSLQLPSLLWHRDVFEQRPLLAFRPLPTPTIQGKAVLYARYTIAFPGDGPWKASLEAGADLDAVEYADIPHVGETIEQGQPVLTLFASAATAETCQAKLRENAEALDRRLWG
jgi:predicted ATP-grasp superfamily ATP-dependent carboligase